MDAAILLIADYASVDAGGKLNIIGAFNQINFRSELPAKYPTIFYLVIRLVAELGEFEKIKTLKVILYDPDRKEIWSTSDMSFTVPPPDGGGISQFNAIIAIQHAEFHTYGRHEYCILVNDDTKGIIPLDIVEVKASEET